MQPRDEFDALERMLERGFPLETVLRYAVAIARVEHRREEMATEEIATASTVPPKE